VFEGLLVLLAQFIFMIFYALLYAIDYKTAHRMIGYFEEEAVRSYTGTFSMVANGEVENVPAPELAIKYYKMKKSAKLSDLIKKVRADEQHHSEVNHRYADGNTSYTRKNG
jgi:ubiquinol oxidase